MKKVTNTIILMSLLMLCAPAYSAGPDSRQFKWLRTVYGQSQRPYSDNFAAFYEAGKSGRTASTESSPPPARKCTSAYTTPSHPSQTTT